MSSKILDDIFYWHAVVLTRKGSVNEIMDVSFNSIPTSYIPSRSAAPPFP